MGIAVEGSEIAGPGRGAKTVLPALDAFDLRTHYFEIFNRGEEPFGFEVEGERAVDHVLEQDVGHVSSTKSASRSARDGTRYRRAPKARRSPSPGPTGAR